jgi:hypothetical protein
LARDIFGNECSPLDPAATSFDLCGALYSASMSYPVDVVLTLQEELTASYGSLSEFNDAAPNVDSIIVAVESLLGLRARKVA